MKPILNRGDAPAHLFSIPELDFSDDLFADQWGGPWFRLGAWTVAPRNDERGVEDVVIRQSLLLSPGRFENIFSKLEAIGNVFSHLGKPGGSIYSSGDEKEYTYAPFYHFNISFTSAVAEPLVFIRSTTSDVQFFINPDLWMFFELEEKTPGCGIWYDPRRGVDALIQQVIDAGNLKIVEIRVDYLRKYLQARQMALVVGHYRHLRLSNPSPNILEMYVAGDITLGAPDQGAKAILENRELRQEFLDNAPYLLRRLHLWSEISPQEIDIDNPWSEQPSFDIYSFLLPTHSGLVAPGRWKVYQENGKQEFEGETCDFMDRIFFRQEVLMKYERASGFIIKDDGSVHCHHYWGIDRGIRRIGNELLITSIGDFAEGLPFEEWPHWKQYAVEPPSHETIEGLKQEQTIPDAVNSLVRSLRVMNSSFESLAAFFGIETPYPLWRGSLDSLAGRQLKWVYPATADDDEFLKRATLASTLVIEGLVPKSLRKLLVAIDENLHMTFEKQPRPLASRNLLQRLTLIAILIDELQPNIENVPLLVTQAESKKSKESMADIQPELDKIYRRVRDEFAPLAFLYDLRTHGGIAHLPNKVEIAKTAEGLGLPKENWHRKDYINLLKKITGSIENVSECFKTAISG